MILTSASTLHYVLDNVMSKTFRKRRLFISIGLSALLLLLVGLYFSRGWIRGSLIPAYVQRVYKPQVDRAFNSTFQELKTQFEKAGFTFKTYSENFDDSCQTLNGSEDSLTYQRISESDSCNKMVSSDTSLVNPAFVNYWHTQSPNLQRYLASGGWARQTSDTIYSTSRLTRIFDDPLSDGGDQTDINFSKSYGKVNCSIDFNYLSFEVKAIGGTGETTAIPNTPNIQVDYQCDRNVNFFGGYSGL